MPRSTPSSSPQQLSNAIDLFIHKDRSSFFDDDSIALGTVAPFEHQPALADPQTFNWDLPTTCARDFAAYHYISNKLHQRELSVALIISDREPYMIPVWPLPRKSQLVLAQIIRKAVKKYRLQPSWLTALAAASNKCLPSVFEAHQPDSYIVRRSIVQNEIVFSEEGLTLLTIDFIFTFKQLLQTLSKKAWVPQARDVCLSSCVSLLHRINELYTEPQMSGGYLKRVYKDIDFHRESWQEVTSAYNVNYCTASIKDVTMLDPDFTALSDIASNVDIASHVDDDPGTDTHKEILPSTPDQHSSVAELPDTSPRHTNSSIISPLESGDRRTMDAWRIQAARESDDYISPLSTRYPTFRFSPPRQPSVILESPIDPDAPWSHAIPPPLRTNRNSSLPTTNPQPPSHEPKSRLVSIPASREMVELWNKKNIPVAALPESVGSAELRSTMDYVNTWIENWSSYNAQGVLCENCHEVAIQPLVPRRYTMA